MSNLRRDALRSYQLQQLRALLTVTLESNPFYSAKLRAAGVDAPPESIEDFTAKVPFTYKQEFADDQLAHPPYGTNLTYPVADYRRFHQTSGTTSAPIRWLDTEQSWSGMIESWQRIFASAGLRQDDRVLFPFAFGPFIGFWLAFHAAERTGALVIAAGGVRTEGRLQLILDNAVTVVSTTPTYAIRMGQAAREQGVDLSRSKVRILFVAGEAGGSVPATRALIQKLWPTAKIVDHHGMTEVGPVSYQCPRRPGVLHVMEQAYLPEVIDPETLEAVGPGQTGELVLTNLHRLGSPALRYRTRDLVRRSAETSCECGSDELALEGGILARVDDMLVVRGVNLYPAAVEEVLWADGGVAEFRVEIKTERGLPEVSLLVEPSPDQHDAAALAERLTIAMHGAFGLRFAVKCVNPGELPRFEAKANRWIRL